MDDPLPGPLICRSVARTTRHARHVTHDTITARARASVDIPGSGWHPQAPVSHPQPPIFTYKTKLKLDKEVGGVGFCGFCVGMETFAFLFGMTVSV